MTETVHIFRKLQRAG